MLEELRQNILGVLLALSLTSLAIYSLVNLRLPVTAAHASTVTEPPSRELHEADHLLQAAVYTTTGGWSSNLLLLNAEGKAVTARVTLYNRKGRSLNIRPITLEAYKSRSWNVADWIGSTEGFEDGSLTVSYNGLSMGLHAQETVTNPERSLSFDVHLEDAMEFMSSTVDGLWWGLDNRNDAKVFISNTKATETTVTPIFYVTGVAHQGEPIVLKAHASDVVDLGKELKELHLSAPLGGISFTYTNGPGALSVVGVITSNHIGFSTTMRFFDHMMGTTTSLHGANIMIGKPASNAGLSSAARFTPHVIVRNVTDQPIQVNSRIRFTLFDQLNTSDLIPATIGANEVRELDLSPAINTIGDNAVADAGIEIDYSGQPGAIMAYGASVDQAGSNAFDVPIKDPMEMVFKGGANPWRIDGNNQAVLHVKNVDHPDGKKREFTVTVYYDGGVYNLPIQSVEAGQTAEIDIKELRDEQVKDSTGNVIPLSATQGQLSWYPVAKKGEFVGRLVQYNPAAGTSSSFSCSEPCWCGPDYASSFLSPSSFDGVPGDIFQVRAYAVYMTCNGWPMGPYLKNQANFYTDNPLVADVIYPNYVILIRGGSTNVTGYWDDYVTEGEYCNEWDWASGWCMDPVCPQATVNPAPQAQINSLSLNGNTTIWWFNDYDSPDTTHYPLVSTLTASGGGSGSYTYRITSGSDKAGLGPDLASTYVTSSNQVDVTSRKGSRTANDVVITVERNGRTSAPFYMTVRRPYYVSEDSIDNSVPDVFGFKTVISITLWDNLNERLLYPVPVSEFFTTGQINDLEPTNWQRETPNWTYTVQSEFTDTIQCSEDLIDFVFHPWNPTPEHPGSTLSQTKVMHFGQQAWVGQTNNNGTGVLVENDTLIFYLDHGAHDPIVSPVP